MEKEKHAYDFENIQSQLDKALGQATRLQKEKDAVLIEADRLRDKYEKAQVFYIFVVNAIRGILIKAFLYLDRKLKYNTSPIIILMTKSC